jgi:hypothetical protein
VRLTVANTYRECDTRIGYPVLHLKMGYAPGEKHASLLGGGVNCAADGCTRSFPDSDSLEKKIKILELNHYRQRFKTFFFFDEEK